MNPFLPNYISKRNRIKIILEFLLLLIRLPFFLGFTLQIIIFNDLLIRKLQNLELLPNVYKFIRIITLLHNFFIGRSLLLIIGYYNIQSLFKNTVQNYQHKNLQSYSLFCSRTSPIDIFTLITYFSPSFTHISLQKRQVKYQLISYYQAIIDSFYIEQCSFKQFNEGNEIQELMELIDKKRIGPLIVFWEGGISNGQYFLKIDNVMINEAYKVNSYAKQNKLKVKYDYSNPTGLLSILTNKRVNLIGNSCIKMLFNLLSNCSCQLEMHFLKLPYYQFDGYKLNIIYDQFINGQLKRKLSKKNWLDFISKYVRNIN